MYNYVMLFPQGKIKALTFSYDDGQRQDIRLIELFNKYGVKGTFNLNSGNMEKSDETKTTQVTLEQIPKVYKGHEVAVHASKHSFLEKLPYPVVVKELYEDRKELEKYTGYIVRGMAYPFGTYSDDVVRIAKDVGIKYSRTVEAHHRFIIPVDWLRMPSTCHHADKQLFELADRFLNEDPTNNWSSTSGNLFYVWGHSYEFRTEEDWERMEKFLEKVANKDDTWYATNIEIYDYVEAYRSLEYSINLKKVYNPSCKDVWIKVQGKVYKIPSGKTVNIK